MCKYPFEQTRLQWLHECFQTTPRGTRNICLAFLLLRLMFGTAQQDLAKKTWVGVQLLLCFLCHLSINIHVIVAPYLMLLLALLSLYLSLSTPHTNAECVWGKQIVPIEKEEKIRSIMYCAWWLLYQKSWMSCGSDKLPFTEVTSTSKRGGPVFVSSFNRRRTWQNN